MSSANPRTPIQMELGPLSLRVRDFDPMLEFYCKDLGLKILRRDEEIVQLGSSATNSDPLLILRHDAKAERAPLDAAGLYHFALLLPDRRSLAAAYMKIGDAGVVFDGFADHLVSEALYLTDPEGNGIEIYADRPRNEWKKDEDGQVQMATEPLDIDSLLRELSGVKQERLATIPDGARMGHVHLKVTNLQRSIAFYQEILGLGLMSYWGNAAFLSVGGYHHHIGMNTWTSVGGPAMKKEWIGLEYVTLTFPKKELDELSSKLAMTPFLHGQSTDRLFVSDPDEIELVIGSASKTVQN
jgi:catechol 2,3-dioxygenase